MKKTLYVFRHGETDWNKAKRFQGHSDIDLNELGRAQAEVLQHLLKRLRPQIIFSSDLSRAVNTAKIAAALIDVQIITTPDLREANLGEMEGMLREEIIDKYGEGFIEKWFDPGHKDFVFPGGESKVDHLDRLIRTIEEYMSLHPEYERYGISTHGGSVHRLIHHCSNAPTERIFVTNGTLYEIEVNVVTGDWHFRGQLS